MALFSMRVQVIGRGSGRSIMAAVAYRAGEKIHDARQDMDHDFSRRTDVEHKELLFPADAPAWVEGIGREEFWNAVDAKEIRKDAQTAREIRLMLPRELDGPQRLALVRGYVMHNFVERGMCADVAWHCKLSPTDGLPQPHAHVLLTQRPLTSEGFGPKVRHERVPDPSGATHPDGRPVMVSSNPASWNCSDYYERCREDWENRANAALTAIGSSERIDRRSYLERGLSRLSEPMLGVAYHMRTLYGAMKQRFGQWQAHRLHSAVAQRANDAFARLGEEKASPTDVLHTAHRYIAWFNRQIERLAPEGADSREPEPAMQERER